MGTETKLVSKLSESSNQGVHGRIKDFPLSSAYLLFGENIGSGWERELARNLCL